MSEQYWRVFTWAKDPNTPGWLVASTLWTNEGQQADSYKVLITVDTREEAEKIAAATQQEYDTVRRAYVGEL